MATSPVLLGGPSGGPNHTWQTSGHGGDATPTVLGGPQRFKAGDKIRRCPTSGPGGYVTPAAWGPPHTSKRGGKSRVGGNNWLCRLRHACRLVGPQSFKAWDEITSEDKKWAWWLRRAAYGWGGLRSLREEGQNQKWHTSGPAGYVTCASWGVPEIAHQWAWWVHHPQCLGDPPHFKVRDKVRRGGYVPLPSWRVPNATKPRTKSEVGQQVHLLPTLPRLLGGSLALERGGQNQKWANKWV